MHLENKACDYFVAWINSNIVNKEVVLYVAIDSVTFKVGSTEKSPSCPIVCQSYLKRCLQGVNTFIRYSLNNFIEIFLNLIRRHNAVMVPEPESQPLAQPQHPQKRASIPT